MSVTTLPLPPLVIDAGSTDAPEYSGAAFRSALGGLLVQGPSGAMRPRTGALDPRGMQVTVSGTTPSVAAGGYSVGYSGGSYLCALSSALTLPGLETANATNPRIDTVALRVDDIAAGGGTGSIELITGTPAASPLAPVPAGATAYAVLARISVPRAGNGSPAVTDARDFTAAAGGVVPVASASAMNALSTSPGGLCYRMDVGALFVRTGSAWVQLQAVQAATSTSVSLDSGYSGTVVLSKTGNLVTARSNGQITGSFPEGALVLGTAKIPAEYRPASTVVGPALTTSSFTATATFGTNGNIQLFNKTGDTRTWVQFSGVWQV